MYSNDRDRLPGSETKQLPCSLVISLETAFDDLFVEKTALGPNNVRTLVNQWFGITSNPFVQRSLPVQMFETW
jgi:hypothetical protein